MNVNKNGKKSELSREELMKLATDIESQRVDIKLLELDVLSQL